MEWNVKTPGGMVMAPSAMAVWKGRAWALSFEENPGHFANTATAPANDAAAVTMPPL
jgi:hypothetical protein